MRPVTVDAKVKSLRHALVEPKDEPAFTRTIVTLEIDHELSGDDLAALTYTKGHTVVVTLEQRQGELFVEVPVDEGEPILEDVAAGGH